MEALWEEEMSLIDLINHVIYLHNFTNYLIEIGFYVIFAINFVGIMLLVPYIIKDRLD